MIIDAHHHLWRFDPVEFAWIGADDHALRRDFTLPDLQSELSASGIDGSVAVQARQNLTETMWLLAMARRSPLIRGVVGWVPLADPAVGEILSMLAEDPRLVGVRHVVQGEADPEFLLRPGIARGIACLAEHDLVYDLLVRDHQLPQAIACVDAHPSVRFTLDHAGKPSFRSGLEPWASRIHELARRPNVFCKLSGLATEAGPDWSIHQLRPWVEVLINAFGPRRLLFGSDWPVCLLATSYTRWLDAVRAQIVGLTTDERAAVLGGTARSIYLLKDPT